MSSFTRALLGGALSLAFAAPLHAQAPETSDTVIITARPNPDDPPIVAQARERLSRTPGAVAVVANEMIEERTAQGLSDLLRDVPGVLAQKRYGEESRFSIRGSGLDQSYHQRGVLFAQDGVPFADADGFSDFQKLDPTTARYIEVYKGGNALRFGGAQLGGALNLITPTGKTAQSPYLLRLEGGSFQTLRGGVQVARDWGAWDGFGALTALSTDGFRDHSKQDQARGSFNLGRTFGEDREVRLYAYAADIDQEVPGTLTLAQALASPSSGSSAAIGTNWKRDQSILRTSLQTKWRLGPGALFEGGLYATATELQHPISLGIQQQVATQGAFARIDWTGEIGGHAADLFYGLSYRQGENDQHLFQTTFPINGNALQKAKGVDVFAEGRWWATAHLALVAGGSYGFATRDYTDRLNGANNASKDFEWLAPRVGLIWQSDTGDQIYANVTRSVEPPHYGALVQNPVPGFVPVDAQKAWTAEIGARGRRGPLVWDVTLYRSELEDELLSFTPGPGIPAAFFNAGDTVHQGLEAALDWTIAPDDLGGQWLLRQSYTYSDFKFDGDPIYGDNRMPVAPEHQYRAELRYKHKSGVFIAPNVEWRPDGTYVDYRNTEKAPGYSVWNLNAGWDMKNGATVFVDARNLSDEHYVPEFGAVVDADASTATFYPGEGRALFAGVSYRF